MIIAGLQKLTLIDYPGKMACTVFTFGCNFNCGFCHNPELTGKTKANIDFLDEKDFFDFLETQKGFIEGVCVTGGEPTLQADLPDFLLKIKNLGLPAGRQGFSVKLDTNGSNPEMLGNLIKNNLVDYVAMDIKSPLDRYREISGETVKIDDIKRSAEIIMGSGIDYEFRTTVVPNFHTKDDFEKIGRWLKGAKKYYLQQYRPGKTLDPEYRNLKPNTERELEEFCEIARPYFGICEVRLNS